MPSFIDARNLQPFVFKYIEGGSKPIIQNDALPLPPSLIVGAGEITPCQKWQVLGIISTSPVFQIERIGLGPLLGPLSSEGGLMEGIMKKKEKLPDWAARIVAEVIEILSQSRHTFRSKQIEMARRLLEGLTKKTEEKP